MANDLKSSRIEAMDYLIAGYDFHATSEEKTFDQLVTGFENLEFSMEILECGLRNLLTLCKKESDPDAAIITMVRLLLTQTGVLRVQCECHGHHSREIKRAQ